MSSGGSVVDGSGLALAGHGQMKDGGNGSGSFRLELAAVDLVVVFVRPVSATGWGREETLRAELEDLRT